MSDDKRKNGKNEKGEEKRDHEPPAGAEASATWSGGPEPLAYTATANWLVLRKKEKPAAEIFSVSYVAGAGDEERPVMFVFNGGPGASSAYLHLGVVGPQRVDFPPDGSLPRMPPRLVQNEASWLAFTDLVFVDPVGTGFSRVIESEKSDDGKDKKDDAPDPKEYFGEKRDLESLCEFMGRWLSSHRRWGSPVFVAGESYGGYRVGRLVRMLQESAGIGLNGAILISPALEITTLSPTDYDTLGMARHVADDGGGSGASRTLTSLRGRHAVGSGAERGRGVRDRGVRVIPYARRLDARRRARAHPRETGRSHRPADRARHAS